MKGGSGWSSRLENFPLRLIGLQINSPTLVGKRAAPVDIAHVRRETGEIDLSLREPILFLASIVLPRFFPRQSRVLFRMNEMRRNDEGGKGGGKINEMQFEPRGIAPRSIEVPKEVEKRNGERRNGSVSRDQSRYYDGARDEQSFRARGPHKGIDPFLFIS